ncbi:hypothetical protein STEG23_037916 [Scotinomys teguina]
MLARVIHVHKLPSDVTEGNVISLGLPFGKKKNQAFIEMNTEEVANTMVNYHASVVPVLQGQPIYIQFSNHKKLKTHSLPNQAHAQIVLQAVNSVQFRSLALTASATAMDAGVDRLEPGAQDHCGKPLLPSVPGCAPDFL